jgi:hypothetical protein
MATENFYTNQYDRDTDGTKLPLISVGLDSRRAYEWEVTFELPELESGSQDFFLAAKRVSGAGFKVDKITSERTNDKAFYAGKATPDELTVVFDNIKDKSILQRLYNNMAASYDPATGCFSKVKDYKGSMKVIQLDECRDPVSESRYTGVFMTSWKPSDYDYAQNEFHTISCTFSYDFVVQTNNP